MRTCLAPALALAVLTTVASAAAGEVRDVGGPGITPGPRFASPPERVEIVPKRVSRFGGPVDRRFVAVVVENADTLRIGRLFVRLPDVAAIDVEEICRDESGARWACGRRALLALRQMLGLKKIVCRVPPEARLGTIETSCAFLAGGDLAERFVASGWARALPDGRLAEVEKKARAARIGFWGPAPAPPADAVLRPGAGGVPPDPTAAPLAGGVD